MAIQLGSAYGKVSIDSSGVSSGVGSAVKDLNSLGDIAKKIGGDMQKIGAAMTIGLTVPIVAFFKSSVTSATEAESKLAEVNAVLKSTGGIAGVTSKEIQKMASELQKVTKFSDEEILSGQAMLLTFTKIGKDVFPQATEAVLNMAEKFGSVENASIQLGKALNDPISGVSALRRVGVMLTDEQEKQIKQFMAVNDIASAQKIILQELETEFGGLARAAGDTTAGKFAQLKNSFDDLKEVAGQAIIPILLKLAEAATKMINAFMNMPSWLQKTILVLLALVALAGPMIAFIGTIVSMIGSILSAISFLSQIGISFTAISAAASTAGSALLTIGGAALTALGSILALAVGPVILYLAFKNNFMGITDTAKQLWFIIKYYFGEGWKWLGNAVKGGAAMVMNYFKNMLTQVINYFRNINWGEIGMNMLRGLANGILGGIPAIIAAAAQAGNAALQALRNALDSHSPSRKAEKVGEDTGDGYAIGLDASMKKSIPIIQKNISSSLKIQIDFFANYYKNLDRFMDQNTKNQNAAMKAQAAATQASLKAQAAAMKAYMAAARAFWTGKGIPIASGGGSSSLPDYSEIPGPVPVENNTGVPIENNTGVPIEQILSFMNQSKNPNNLARSITKPSNNINSSKKQIINIHMANGLTIRDAQSMILQNNDALFNQLNSALGGA